MTETKNEEQGFLSDRILHVDNHLIVINKLPSEIVQGDKTGDLPLSELVKEYIRRKYNKPGDAFLGVVHRVDRPVSGAVMFARTSKGLARLNELIKAREIKKKYWAIVRNLPPDTEGTLVHYLVKNEKRNKSYITQAHMAGAKEARMHYRLVASGDHYHMLEVELLTGRHHQIRVQLAAIGCPIKGDLKYGFTRSNDDGSIHLHARQIEMLHPVSKEMIRIIAPAPKGDALWSFFEKAAEVSSE